MKHTFKGVPITLPEYAGAKGLDMFSRQLEKKTVTGIVEKDLHLLFRKKFSAQKGKKTEVFITADDRYKLYVNGKFVTEGPAPAFCDEYYYNTVDISEYIENGENILAVHTLYQGLVNRVFISGDDRTMLIFDVECDGVIVASSTSDVKCTRHTGYSPIGTFGYETQFAEIYDSNSEFVGWEKSEYDDKAWGYASPLLHDDHIFISQPTENLVFEPIVPASVTKLESSILIDFGAMYVGYFTCLAKGEKGSEVTVYAGQELEDGHVRYKLRANCEYAEKWILSGNEDRLEQFDYKSFRYVELAYDADTVITEPVLISRHYPFEQKTFYNGSDEDIKKIWELCVRSLHYGVQDVIQDCMEREKGQYLGDGSFSSTAFAVLTHDTAMMEKLVENALHTSKIDRGLMTCSPCSFMQEIAEYPLMLPELLLADIKLSKSDSFARRHYHAVADVIDAYFEKYSRGDLLLYDLDKWCVVDWPMEARDGYDFDLTEGRIASGTHNVINAYYIGAVQAMNRLAKKLGLPEYRNAKPLEDAYIKAFYDKEKHLFRDTPSSEHYALSSNAFALRFGMCRDEESIQNALSMIMSKPATCSSFFTAYTSLCALKKYGTEEMLYDYIKDEGRWKRMLSEGATATFEAWGKDVKWNTSLFHLCYSFAVIFIADWEIEDVIGGKYEDN